MDNLLHQRFEEKARGRSLSFQVGMLLAAGLVLLLSSCVPAPKPPLPLLNEQDLWQRLQANAKAWHSLRGMTRIRTENSAGSASARQVLLLAKPDSIRAEVLSPFGQPLLLLTVQDGQLRVLLPREQRFLQGEATPERIARFIRLPLSAEQMVRVALYDLPLISHEESALSRHEAGYQLLLSGADHRQRLDFDASGRPLGASYYRGDQLLLQVAYDNFAAALDDFPRQVTVTMPGQDASISMTYNDVELNFQPAAESFLLQPPAGIVVEDLP